MSSTTNRRRRLAAAAAVLILPASLTACADDTGNAGRAEQSSESPPAATGTAGREGTAEDPGGSTEHNDADIAFAQGMIAHHRGALDMAATAVERATTTQVAALAQRIADAQAPEIELMSGWLDAWGADQPGGTEHEVDDGGHAHADGTDEAMAELEELSGTDFDRRFLELMIEHHEAAIPMSETELAEGENKDARTLARTIIDDQTAEITEMRTLLDAL